MSTTVSYSNSPEWADIAPFPQDDGGPNPLAAISYSAHYAEAMSYLRAIMAANEHSPRALSLTESLIAMNPAHYTVWLYRSAVLRTLSLPIDEEIAWLNNVALAHHKNYQIWHHRQNLLDRLGQADGEVAFINRMLRADAKNYHVWSYRQWLVRRFGLWSSAQDNGRSKVYPSDDDEYEPPVGVAERTTELEETALFIAEDVRNNSAWNHRFFVVNGDENGPGVRDEAVCRREVEFAQDAVRRAPQNQSPWAYLRGVVERAHGKAGVERLRTFCEEFVSIGEGEESVRSSHALQLLAEIWARERQAGKAHKALDLLAGTYDPIRVNYWNWLKQSMAVEV